MKKPTVLIIGFGIDKNRYEAVSKNTIKHKKILEGLGYKVLIYNIGYKNPHFNTGASFIDSIKKRSNILNHLKVFIKNRKVTHILDVFVLPLSSQIFTLPIKKTFPKITFIKEIHNDAGFSLKVHPETFIRVLANSQFSLNIVLKNFDKLFTKNLFLSNKINIKYIPTDISIYLKPRTKFNNDKINICYLGHPLKKKGIFEFLGLFKIIPADLKNKIVFNFSFSNVGPREELVEQFRQVAQDNNIEVNFFNEVKPYKFFRKNDIYVLPIHDHFGAVSTPNTILEAMEAGCLVIVHKILSLEGMFNNKEVVYLENYRSRFILKSIEKIFKNLPQEEKRLKRARKEIEKTHSLSNVVNLIKKIYE